MTDQIKPDLPSTLLGATGAGAAVGSGHGLLKNLGNYRTVTQLRGMLPMHESNILKMKELLETTRKSSPGLSALTDRKLTNLLLRSNDLPNDMYHTLRQGAESLSGRSRATKLIRVLGGQSKRKLLQRGLLGAAAGLGGGLLGATALGHFDKQAFNLEDARKAGRALSKYRVRASTQHDTMLGFIPGILRKPKGVLNKWAPDAVSASVAPVSSYSPGNTTLRNFKDVRIFSGGDIGRGVAKIDPRVQPVLNRMRPNEREMANRLMLQHEEAERRAMQKYIREAKVKPAPGIGIDATRQGTPLDQLGDMSRSAGHQSPDILLQESNMLATLPKDMPNVQAMLRTMRDNPKDKELLSRISQVFPEFNYGNTRINRHKRKAITQALLAQ